MTDTSSRCLGRLPTPPEERAHNFRMATYMPAELPAPPAAWNLSHLAPAWPVYANDRIGDCTCAAAAHMLEVWSAQVDGAPRLVEDSDVLALYQTQGYRPGDPSTDRGATLLHVLRAWRKRGLAGDRILAFAEVDVRSEQEVKLGAWIFSGLYCGVALPETARQQTGPDGLWDVTPDQSPAAAPGSWGGHCVNVVDYDYGGLTVITWGNLQRVSWAFWSAYFDEAYVIIPSDDRRLNGRALDNGFNLAQLWADIGRLH